AEFQHVAEFRALTRLAVVRVIAILLAAARVPRGRLDVPVGIRADPDLGPCRGNGQRIEPFPHQNIADPLPVRRVVRPAGADALSLDASERIGYGAQPGAQRGAVVLGYWHR